MENVKYAFNNCKDIYNQPEGYSNGYYTYSIITAMFAVKEDNTLWSWGSNSEEMYDGQGDYGENISGVLGNGTTYDSYKPLKIMENVKYANCGSYCGYATKVDDTLCIWGANITENLGKDIGKRILKPTKMMEDVKYANIYYYSGYAIKNDNSLWGWGANYSDGYLGNG